MLKAVLATVIERVMQDGLQADTVLVHHLLMAKVRVEDLLKIRREAA